MAGTTGKNGKTAGASKAKAEKAAPAKAAPTASEAPAKPALKTAAPTPKPAAPAPAPKVEAKPAPVAPAPKVEAKPAPAPVAPAPKVEAKPAPAPVAPAPKVEAKPAPAPVAPTPKVEAKPVARPGASVTFTAGWKESVQGDLVGGGQVTVSYEPARAPLKNGSGWGVQAFVKLVPSGQIVEQPAVEFAAASPKARAVTVDIPRGTTELQVWFRNWVAGDKGEVWDSNFGLNYRFPVRG